MAAEQREQKPKGMVLGRGLELRPDPPPVDLLPTPLSLTDFAEIAVPKRTVLENLQEFLQLTGLRALPPVVRLRWQAHDRIAWLQASLIPKARGKGQPILHPAHLMPQVQFMMGLPNEADVERRLIQMLIGRALVEYRKRLSQIRQKPFLFARAATTHFFAGFKDEQTLGRVNDPGEHLQMMQNIYNNYTHFNQYYVSAVASREPSDGGNKLFSKFLRVAFFLARVEDDGSLSKRLSYRLLPPRDHVVFLARRDPGLQMRLAQDEALRAELQKLMKTFRPLER